jgi:hypothetical protein
MSNKNNTIKNQIIHDIRNFKGLTNEQINLLLSLSEKEKNEILLLYNEIVKTYEEYLSDHK